MAKFFGPVGFAQSNTEVSPGVFREAMIERSYYGDVVRNSRRLDEVDKVNLDISVGNTLSIVADAYANEHFFAIRYTQWAGSYWIVTDVTVERPRLLLRLGGVYNGPRAQAP